MTDLAIRVENLSKLYHIGRAQQRHDTLLKIRSRITEPTKGRAETRPPAGEPICPTEEMVLC